MKNYKDTDYAINKYSEGIVYQFADGRKAEVTLADYLRENPGKTETDFMELKALSDAIYHEQDLECNRHGKRVRTLERVENTERYAAAPDMELIHQNDLEQAAKAAKILVAGRGLTEVQKRRFFLYFYQGLSYRQIAAQENVDFTSVRESIKTASAKLRKIFEKI